MNSAEGGASDLIATLPPHYVLSAMILLTFVRWLIYKLSLTGPRSNGPPSWAVTATELIESVLLLGSFALLIVKPFLVQAFYIPSSSMENTLMGHEAGAPTRGGLYYPDAAQDKVFVDKLRYRAHDPARGDIAVFRSPAAADSGAIGRGLEAHEDVFIKRVIGIPGDTLLIDRGRVIRNGESLREPYLPEPMKPVPGAALPFAGRLLRLGPGQYFMMGDNRNVSNDSRFWGPVTRDRFIGRAVAIFWPPNRMRSLN